MQSVRNSPEDMGAFGCYITSASLKDPQTRHRSKHTHEQDQFVMDPADFKCPISQEVMTDPVLAADGHTYEREMIAEWLRIRRTSPLTNEQMPSTNLMPNITLKKVIEGWLASHFCA